MREITLVPLISVTYLALAMFEVSAEADMVKGSEKSRSSGVTKNIATAELCEDTEVNLTKLKLLYVESPGYGIGGENYPTGQECTLLVKGNSACQVATICKDFDFRPTLCNEEYLVIANGRDDGRPSTKLCGDSASTEYFKADMGAPAGQQNTLRFELKTSQNSEFDRVYKGIRCLVKCVEPEGGTGEEGPGPSSCPPCECEISNTTIDCPTTTCPSNITTCPELACTAPAPIDCPTTTCSPCDPCELTTTACPNITCPSPSPTTTCPQIDCPTIEPETCPATACPPCECPTQCPVINCPPPPPTTACPIIECPTTIQTICPPPPEPTTCPEKVCPACPEPKCPPPPKCPEAPKPRGPPNCDTFYTIVNAVDNQKLDSRFSRDRGVGNGWFDVFSFNLDRWWITKQDVGVRFTSTNKPTFVSQFYVLRMHYHTKQLGLEFASNAGNKKEFKWNLLPRRYGKQDEYVAIENQYNKHSIQYNGYENAVIMAPTAFGEMKQWWKLVPEGDFIGCTKYCKIMSKADHRLLSLNNKNDKRVMTYHYNGGDQVAWNIFDAAYGYRVAPTDMDGNWCLSNPPDRLKTFGLTDQIWHFIPARGPGGWYFIRNFHTFGYLRNMGG